MPQPNYTWWPWQVLSAAVGFTSGAIVVTWLDMANYLREREPVAMALAIFAGGNALILGMSIGDLGRTILALLLSIAAASLFSLAPVNYGLLAPLIIVPLLTASLSIDRTLFGFAASAYLGLRTILIGAVAYGIVWLLIVWLWSLVTRKGNPDLLAVPIACAVGNAMLIGFLFMAARRAQADRQLPSSEEEA